MPWAVVHALNKMTNFLEVCAAAHSEKTKTNLSEAVANTYKKEKKKTNLLEAVAHTLSKTTNFRKKKKKKKKENEPHRSSRAHSQKEKEYH